jgi:formate dehydrogenase beta subunit
LLLTCGRVCPHPCEDYCRRGIEDEPVSINQLKRFVADYEMNSGHASAIPCAPDTGKRVAIIGGGPAGVSCAYFLRRLGHHPTIYDAMSKLGGITRYGIPEYRLPDEVLDWEIEGILNLGIDVHYNNGFREDFTIQSLREEAMMPFSWVSAPGRTTPFAIKRRCRRGLAGHQLSSPPLPIHPDKRVPVGKRAAVVGGGNSAIDCVRTLKRLGCEEVYIVYRRTRKLKCRPTKWKSWPPSTKASSFSSWRAHTGPSMMAGNVKGLEYLQMELGEPDASGRRRPVPIEGSETSAGRRHAHFGHQPAA